LPPSTPTQTRPTPSRPTPNMRLPITSRWRPGNWPMNHTPGCLTGGPRMGPIRPLR
jgi:hypothetical protein